MIVGGLIIVGGVTVITGINHLWHHLFLKGQFEKQTAELKAAFRNRPL
jgi:hypothetical protein